MRLHTHGHTHHFSHPAHSMWTQWLKHAGLLFHHTGGIFLVQKCWHWRPESNLGLNQTMKHCMCGASDRVEAFVSIILPLSCRGSKLQAWLAMWATQSNSSSFVCVIKTSEIQITSNKLKWKMWTHHHRWIVPLLIGACSIWIDAVVDDLKRRQTNSLHGTEIGLPEPASLWTRKKTTT